MKVLVMALALACAALPAGAVNPGEMLTDPILEARARDIGKELRCLVCQNQSIDDSDAPLARDLRVLVRQRLTAGDSDRQVIDYVVSRYGDFVLLRPPFKGSTLILWLGPGLIGGLGIIALAAFFRRRAGGVAAPVAEPLSDAERRRLAALLEDQDR